MDDLQGLLWIGSMITTAVFFFDLFRVRKIIYSHIYFKQDCIDSLMLYKMKTLENPKTRSPDQHAEFSILHSKQFFK